MKRGLPFIFLVILAIIGVVGLIGALAFLGTVGVYAFNLVVRNPVQAMNGLLFMAGTLFAWAGVPWLISRYIKKINVFSAVAGAVMVGIANVLAIAAWLKYPEIANFTGQLPEHIQFNVVMPLGALFMWGIYLIFPRREDYHYRMMLSTVIPGFAAVVLCFIQSGLVLTRESLDAVVYVLCISVFPVALGIGLATWLISIEHEIIFKLLSRANSEIEKKKKGLPKYIPEYDLELAESETPGAVADKESRAAYVRQQ